MQSETIVSIIGLANSTDRSAYLQKLLRAGVNGDHFRGLERKVFDAAHSLLRLSRSISEHDILDVAALTEGEKARFLQLWALRVELDALGFVDTLKTDFLKRQLVGIHAQLGELLAGPRSPQAWGSELLTALTAALDGSRPYDTDPLSIYLNAPSGSVYCPTGLGELDKALRGGLRLNDYILALSFTKRGKTTLAVSIAANLVELGVRTAFFPRERTHNEANFNVLRALIGDKVPFADLEDQANRNPLKMQTLERMRECIRFYPIDAIRTVDDIEAAIASWYSVVNIVDPQEGLAPSAKASGPLDWRGAQEVSQRLLQVAGSSRRPCVVFATAQLPPGKLAEWKEKGDIDVTQAYGSAAPVMKSNNVFIVDRNLDPLKLGTSILRHKFSTRFGGPLNDDYDLFYDAERGCFIDSTY